PAPSGLSATSWSPPRSDIPGPPAPETIVCVASGCPVRCGYRQPRRPIRQRAMSTRLPTPGGRRQRRRAAVAAPEPDEGDDVGALRGDPGDGERLGAVTGAGGRGVPGGVTGVRTGSSGSWTT